MTNNGKVIDLNDKGSLAAETAVVFPLFLILLVALTIVMAKTIVYEKPDGGELINGIHVVDSIIRKAAVVDEVFK